MTPEPIQVASLSDLFFTWVQTQPQQVIFVVVTYVIAFVLIKKDKLG